MKYEQLKKFICDEMIMRDNRNYQPVMIRYLNQNRGKATRLEIQQALHNANPKKPVKDFKKHIVFNVLTESHSVAKANEKEDTFYLLDYETFTPQNKAWITMYCDEKIKNSLNPINNRIILFSVAGKKAYDHFRKTIVNDVDTSSLHVDSILKEYPKVRVWGSVNTKTQFNKWRDLKKGDILLFYHDKKYLGSGILEGTEKNSELADSLWGYKDPDTKQSFELVMFMKTSNVFNEDVESLKLNKLLDYSDKFMPTRTLDFFPVVKNKTDDLIEKFGSLENALKTIGFSFSETKTNDENFERLVLKFDNDRNYFVPARKSETERNQIRDEFEKKFPLEKLKTMKITEYVQGKRDSTTGEPDRTTFSYMLELGVPDFGGIGGTPASKFGIYFSREEKKYAYKGNFSSPESAFEAVRDDVIRIVQSGNEFVEGKDWEKLSDAIDDKSEHLISSHVRSKILALYFPNDILDIHSRPKIKLILDYFKIDSKEIEDRLTIMQSKLLEIKEKHHIMNHWSVQDFSHFVWEAIILEKLTNNQTNYLLFYHSPPGKQSHAGRNIWDDKIGNEYPYGNKSGATSKVIPGSKAVWMYTENDEIYFWGHGEIKSNNKIDDKKSMATMNSFERLGIDNKPKKASASLRDKIKSKERGKWNQSNAIMEIDDKIYNEIIYEETVKEKTFEDEPLPIPTPKDVREGIQEISEFLTIPPEKIREILTGLTSGNNIILSGPIGTGKTELARLIPEIFWKSKGGYHANMFTATADWNTQDVIGGIVPKMNGDNVTYKIQDGCVTESVRKNWDGAQRTYSPGKKESFRGVWTIIDEFNRADIDKAFGQLFTALRTKDLKAPTDRLENYEKIRIPQDYRIIGTLNTADKHYLFQLSDALKSRFLVIEIGLPGLDKKDEEVYYAIKNALRNFSIEPNSIVSFRNGKVIKKDQKFYDLLYQAYNFLSFVRLFKKLGTAILKTVYQNLVAGYKMKYNLKEVLDNSINSVIIPQLEGLPEIELSLINNLQKNNLDEFFKKLNKSRNKRTVSKEVLAKTLNFLKIPEKDFEDFENSEIKDKKVWDKLKINESKQKSEDKMVTNLKQVERSLELLIEQSII